MSFKKKEFVAIVFCSFVINEEEIVFCRETGVFILTGKVEQFDLSRGVIKY